MTTIINDELNSTLNEMKLGTESNIINMQNCKCPVLNIVDFKNVYYYKQEGYKTSLVEDNTQIYKSSNIAVRKHINNTKISSNKDLYLNFVSKGILFPLMMFVNGKFQKWSNVSFVMDKDCDYIIIEGIPDHTWNLNVVLLPYDNVLYLEDCENDVEDVNTIINNSCFTFKFNSEGVLIPPDSTEAPYTIIGIKTNEELLVHKTDGLISDKFDYFNIGADFIGDGIISNKNMIAFDKDNLFVHDFDKHIERISSVTYKTDKHENMRNIKSIYAFKYAHSNKLSKNPLKRLQNDESEFDTLYHNNTGKAIEYYNFNENSDNRSGNVKNVIKDALNYDQSILNNEYIRRSKIHTREYVLKDFVDKYKISDKSYLCRLPRTDSGYKNNEIMIFIDGDLYKSHNTIEKDAFNFYINLTDYKDKPKSDLEILFVNNVQNGVFDATILKNQDTIVGGGFDPDNVDILCNYVKGNTDINTEFSIDGEKDVTYLSVESEVTKAYSGYRVSLSNEKLYGKPVKWVSKLQFHHQKIVNPFDRLENTFYLNEDFHYTKERSNFLVFVNQRKVDPDRFVVQIPSDTVPFYRTTLVLGTFLEKDDVVDIFYLPMSLETKVLYREIVSNHNIKAIAEDEISYNLSKDLEFFFVNGKLINKKYIYDVQADQVVISNISSFKNINVLYHIPENKIIKEVYKSVNKDEYTKLLFKDMMKYLSSKFEDDEKEINITTALQEYTKNKGLKFSDSEKDMLVDYAALPSIIYNTIMKYYAPRGITLSNKFLLDIEELNWLGEKDISKNEDGSLSILTLFRDEGLLQYRIIQGDPNNMIIPETIKDDEE